MATGVSRGFWKARGDVEGFPRSQGKATIYPRLEFDGKKPEQEVLTTPPAKVATIWRPADNNGTASPNRLYFGNNIDVLAGLYHDPDVKGQVRLVYIDPPYATSMVFQSRDQSDAYRDTLVGAQYVESLRERLIFLRELLANDGSIYVHLDYNMAFEIKLVMDEVFGRTNFRNWITRKKCNPKNFTRKTYGNISDCILFYTKSAEYVWNRPMEKWTKEWADKEYQYVESVTGRRFKKVPVHAPGVRRGATGMPWRGQCPPPGKHWQYTPVVLDEMDSRGEIYWSPTGNPRRKIYLDEKDGVSVQDIWMGFRDAHNQNIRVTGYPTEKNPELLARIIGASSNPGDLVLDCFAGSGTTLVVASGLQRRWIGIDNSRKAIAVILRRFARGSEPMGDFVNRNGNLESDEDAGEELSLFQSLADAPSPPFLSSPAQAHRPIRDFSLYAVSSLLYEARKLVRDGLEAVGIGGESLAGEGGVRYGRDLPYPNGIAHLKRADKKMATVIDSVGDCRLSSMEGGFGYLAEGILHQQLSKAAAATIVGRVRMLCGPGGLTHAGLQAVALRKLRAAGVSRRKIEYLADLSQKVETGDLDFAKLVSMSDEEVVASLTRVKGIGRWTAEMYLIFVLGRLDVFPIDDIALRTALCRVYHLTNGKSYFQKAVDIADRWKPYRSIGSWYLWAYLNQHRASSKWTALNTNS